MAFFSSTFVNKVDKKGRVSVPAPFRAVLTGQTFHGIVAYPSLSEPAIDASGIDRMAMLSNRLDADNPFTAEYDPLADAIFGDSVQLAFDPEGRVQLPEALREHAAIGDQAAFVGRGPSFQIWEPEAMRRSREEIRRRARETIAAARAETK
ncbi:MAG: division/cell wall cluster transcriptional repressor MraZ [Rhodospirillaceae bacterium]|mgnify:CR=1 FL=1|jgi:MraZ protein|nr:division/cell wall cluster transcriptional repressor MraZ [Rhodospirillaceae bacterium]|tara:strand:- start:2649 stop:3101 length:453 start_codon:yes stop_codon:yes gene_type:complete